MPKFTIEAPDGRKFDLEGDSPPTEQELEQVFSSLPSGLKQSTKDTLAEREAFGKQYTEEAQASPLSKIGSAAVGLGKGLISPVVAGVKAIPGALEIAQEPSRIIPTTLEGARRAGMDIGNLGASLAQMGPKLAASVAGGPIGMAQDVYGLLKSRTPQDQEVQKAYEALNLKKAVEEERNKTAFQGAQPEVAEAGAQIAPLLVGAGEVKGLAKGLMGAKAAATDISAQFGRSIRSALKPSNANLASRVEKAGTDEFGEIFRANPNADKIGSMPMEGFHQTVKSLKNDVGDKISAIQQQIGEKFTAGDDLASALEKKADQFENAGESSSDIQYLRDRANDLKGKVTDINSLQTAVGNANIRTSPQFNTARMGQGAARANVENVADRIIAEEGGSAINSAMESIGGPEAAGLRKQWSNLSNIEKSASDRVNKMINQAPAEAQSALMNTLTSPEGIVGVAALVHGWAGGAIPVAVGAIKGWAKRAAKDLKDSNVIIENAYNRARSSPPVQPPPYLQKIEALKNSLSPEELRNLGIAQSIESETPRTIPAQATPIEPIAAPPVLNYAGGPDISKALRDITLRKQLQDLAQQQVVGK